MRSARPLLFASLLSACSSGHLCDRFFKPFPDLVGERARTDRNEQLLIGMDHYRNNRYEEAIPALQSYAEADPEHRDVAYIYLTSCFLALDRPFDAELQLDFLKRHHQRNYRDEVDWYYALCWLCSDQQDRALAQAQRIAETGQSAYAAQAAGLVSALSN